MPTRDETWVNSMFLWVCIVVATFPLLVIGCSRSETNDVSIIVPLNVHGGGNTFEFEFAVPKGWYFSSLFIRLPENGLPDFEARRIGVEVSVSLDGETVDRNTLSLDLSKEELMNRAKRQAYTAEEAQTPVVPWPSYAVAKNNGRMVCAPLGVAFDATRPATQGKVTLTISDCGSVPQFLDKWWLRLDTYHGK